MVVCASAFAGIRSSAVRSSAVEGARHPQRSPRRQGHTRMFVSLADAGLGLTEAPTADALGGMLLAIETAINWKLRPARRLWANYAV